MATKKRKQVSRCAVCGAKATHKMLSVPMCDSIPCEVFRQETIKEELFQELGSTESAFHKEVK